MSHQSTVMVNLRPRGFEVIENNQTGRGRFWLPGAAFQLKYYRRKWNGNVIPGRVDTHGPGARQAAVIRGSFKDYVSGGLVVANAPVPV